MVPIVSIVILSTIVLKQFHSLQQNNVWVDHTNEVLIEAHDIEKLMVDMETGQRGFIITGKDTFLEPFDAALQTIFKEITALKFKVSDNPIQVARLNEIEKSIDEWLKTAGYPEIEARRKFDQGKMSFDEVAHLFIVETGKQQMDSFRVAIAEFISVEEQLKKEREHREASSIFTTKIFLILGGAFIALVCLITGIYSSKVILVDDWLKTTLANILSPLQGVTNLEEFSKILFSHLAPIVSAPIASLYVVEDVDREDDTKQLHLAGSYGVDRSDALLENLEAEQSLMGQCIDHGQVLQITDIPDSYFDIHSSLGKAKPRQITLFPVRFEDATIAVIELASFAPFKKNDRALLDAVTHALGAVVANTLSRKRTETLWRESKDKSQKLEQQQAAIEKSSRSLAVSEARNRAIIENSINGIITINATGTVQSFSPSAERIFGYSEDEVIGQNVKMLMPSPYHEQHDGYLKHYHDTGEKRVIGKGREVEAKRKDGTTFPIRLGVGKIQLDGENLYVGTVTDITDEKAAREAIERKSVEAQKERIKAEAAAAKAEEANRTKSEFLANMSHELRTPLNSLLILARELRDNDEGNLTNIQVDDAGIIYESGHDLLTLINDILDLAKIESGKMSVSVEDVFVQDLVQSIHTKFSHVAKDKGIELKINVDSGVCDSIKTDRLRIEQIIRNLLSNAFKFTHEGSVTLRIYQPQPTVHFRDIMLHAPEMLALEVSDTGIGISPEQQDRVFEAFQQADGSTTRQYGGTGLGLSISQELAELLGGEIHLQSQPGVGSTFTLYIKQVLVAPHAQPRRKSIFHQHVNTQKTNHTPVLSESQLSTPVDNPLMDDRDTITSNDTTILVVDDDQRFASIIQNKIRKRGYKCLVATDGISGLRLIAKYRPNATILDIDLPEINGVDIYERVRQHPDTCDMPIYFISVHDNAPVLSDDNAVGFLSKPVSTEQLEQAFNQIEILALTPVKHLLIVEDDQTLRQSVSQVMQKRDIRISEAANGIQALELLKSETPDCILLDLMMPEMDGITFLKRVAEDDVIPLPRVIVYSAKSITDEEAKVIERYTDSFIQKNGEFPEEVMAKMFAVVKQTSSVKPLTNTPASSKASPEPPAKTNDCASPVETPSTASKNPTKTSHDFSGKEILIVDDEPRNVFALSRMLSRTQVQIHTAQNGQEALEMLQTHPNIQCVLMDMMMPVMNGYDAIRAIRKQDQWETLPVIAVTAKAMQEDKEKCMETGATAYIPKPVNKDILLNILSKHFNQFSQEFQKAS